VQSATETDEDADTADTERLNRLRNIGVVAHIDAGKTTTTERILFYTGKTHRMGEVDAGTTATDFDEQEQQRGITIFSAAVTCPWRDHVINLIDTPGHVDFTAEVERSLRVLDGAVIVFDAKEGVEAQSETVWRQARKYSVPAICFINKMDKIGADFARAVESIQKRLHANPVPVQIPIGADSSFEGVIDLLTMRAYHFNEAPTGAIITEGDIPDHLIDEAKHWRHQLEERVAETDDALMEKYLEEHAIESEEIRAALRRATVASQVQPVFCGSALKHIGVQKVLDGVIDYLPSPLERPPVLGVRSTKDQTQLERHPDTREPMSALVFKIVAEKPLDLYYLRVYSGRLKSGSRLLNSDIGKKENISRMFRMFAKRREQIDEALPGDIVACVGLKDTLTGHTLCDPKDPIVLEQIEFPTPVISVSVEPRNTKDKDALGDALVKLTRQDPTFTHRFDPETGQTVISGMGELHLEVLAYKLEKDFRVPVRVGRPLVAYRETITHAGEAEGSLIRATGAQPQYAVVTLRVEPFKMAPGEPHFEFVNEVPADVLPQNFVAAVRQGARDSMASGVLAGYELLGIRATLVAAKVHETDSSELAFESAARMAFEQAVKNAGPVMLEPIMKLEVLTSEEYFGPVSGDLSARRGLIQETEMREGTRVIRAHVPLAEMFEYATKLRTLSQGRATWSMEPHAYAPMPPALQKEFLRRYGYEA